MSELVSQAVDLLRAAGVNLARGLTDSEISRIEQSFGFSFGEEHRALLAAALPTGQGWIDWRNGPHDDLQSRLNWPIEGVMFDVHNNDFWPSSWGDRPAEGSLADEQAREHLASVPKLIPVYSHRFLPAAPAPLPSPVFSVYQTDVIFYGDNLLDYVAHEFNSPPRYPAENEGRQHIGFWSDLAEGAEDSDL